MILKKFYEENFSNATSAFKILSHKKLNDKVLFLDRDGVLIEDVHHIDTPEKVSIRPKVINFLKSAREKFYDLVIVTNQSSVSRSIITYEQYKDITDKFLSFLTEDLYPDLILSSFHLPNNENNLENFNWRKPGTGMIDFALKNKNYDKSKSAIVGDKLTDLISGYKSGLSNLIFVQSPLHKNESTLIKSWSQQKNISYIHSKELNSNFL